MLQVKPGARLDLYSDANVDPLFNFQYGLEHPQKSRPGIEMGNVTLSPYRRGDVTFSSYAAPLRGPRRELDAASKFANSVLNSVPCPSALVLDVGIIKGRGWAVVEPNECWGAGI